MGCGEAMTRLPQSPESPLSPEFGWHSEPALGPRADSWSLSCSSAACACALRPQCLLRAHGASACPSMKWGYSTHLPLCWRGVVPSLCSTPAPSLVSQVGCAGLGILVCRWKADQGLATYKKERKRGWGRSPFPGHVPRGCSLPTHPLSSIVYRFKP